MERWSRGSLLSLLVASLWLAGCSHPGSSGGSEASSGTGASSGAGASDGAGGSSGSGAACGGSDTGTNACAGMVNPAGPVVDLPWPAVSNVGNDVAEGNTLHFHWSGAPHNVLQVASFLGQVAPVGTMGDADWPGELTSGA